MQTTKNSVWKAYQIVESNGAYGGQTVRFMTERGLVTAPLRRAVMSQDDNQVLIGTGTGTTDWNLIHQDSFVEVMA